MRMNDVDMIAELFKALGDNTRLRIVRLLAEAGELCVCDIERVLALPQARVSRHLAVLRSAGLVRARREGQWMHYALRKEDALSRSVIRVFVRGTDGAALFVKDSLRLKKHAPACCAPEDGD